VRYDFAGSTGSSGGLCAGWDLGGSLGGVDIPGSDAGVVESAFMSLSVCGSVRCAGFSSLFKGLTEN